MSKLAKVYTLTWIFGYLILHTRPVLAKVSAEKQLYTDLFSDYDRNLRPIEGDDYFHQIVVDVHFTLSQIIKLNEKEEHMTSRGGVQFTWTDQLLQWNASDYNGASSLVLPADAIWLPEFTPINSVNEAFDVAYDNLESRVNIQDDGTVIWVPYMKWSTSCPINITEFPYDVQECTITFANWMHTAILLNYTVHEDVDVTAYNVNSGWDLLEAKSFYTEYPNGGRPIPFIHMKVRLKRNPVYFEMNVVLPAILLSFLLIPMFILPVDSGEKVSLGVTLMLSYSIFLLMLTDYTPQSGNLPNITSVLLVSIVFAGLGMFCNVIIINIHYHMPDKEVPRWVRKLFIEKIGLCLRLKYESHATQVEPLDMKVPTKQEPSKKMITDSQMDTLLEYLEYFRTKQLENNQVDQNRENWNKVARVLDRIFFLVYIIYFVAMLFALVSIKLRNM